ncbi:MAG: DNA topoisomerase I [Nanoarchaeota archaeon]|nr:DNA topoisomerase I [Nanoarchaeota archaeon]
MIELIICEKPMAALKIATALADKKPIKNTYNKIPYYELTHKGKKIIVGCSVGHLFNLAEKEKKAWTYPIFSYEWKPIYITDKSAKYAKNYIDTLKKLSKDADSFIVSTDFDEEGSLLGEKIIKFICKQKDAKRMKFSSLTKQELINSYEHVMPHLDWPQIIAGETRHELDWITGINVSRALTLAVKNAGSFKILSSGRVQGPTLKILADRDKKIRSFKPEPFWQIQLLGDIDSKKIEAWHKKDKFWKKKDADKVLDNTKGKKAIIAKITKKEFKQIPPFPFDLTTLQIEAYRTLKISPKQTLSLTQNLYITGVITYPRTSSQQIPKTIDCKKILKDLSKQTKYKSLCEELLKKSKIAPTNGPKKDPAHPPCLPTGEIPKKITEKESQLYDLIVRRTLATFSNSAIREKSEIELDCNKELFIAKGIKTIKEGWHKFYKSYLKLEEKELPKVEKEQEIKNPKINLIEKETSPPKRYTQASIIKELTSKNLGTKSTRALIVDALYQRDYIKEKAIEVTDLGLKIIQILDKYVPKIIDEKLTRHFEEEMEDIRKEKRKKEDVINEAKEELTKILNKFKQKEKQIGKELLEAVRETQNKSSIVGKCPACKKGDLRILYSKRFKSYFVACSAYPKCKTTFSLTRGLPKPTDKKCPECGYPLVQIIRKGKKPFFYCISKSCPAKERWIKEQQSQNHKS